MDVTEFNTSHYKKDNPLGTPVTGFFQKPVRQIKRPQNKNDK